MSEPEKSHIEVRAYFLSENRATMGLPDLGPWANWFEAELEERRQLDEVNHPPLKHRFKRRWGQQ